MPVPPTAYASFAGTIDQQSIARIFQNMAGATQGGATTVHLLFQSTGGPINDGIAFYNYIRTVPLELHMYNCGAVQSIALLGFIGARFRHVSQHGTFLIHKAHGAAQQGTNAAQFKAIGAALIAEDARIETIIKAHTNIPRKWWTIHQRRDVIFNAQQAVDFGIADDIREFVVPAGNQIFNI